MLEREKEKEKEIEAYSKEIFVIDCSICEKLDRYSDDQGNLNFQLIGNPLICDENGNAISFQPICNECNSKIFRPHKSVTERMINKERAEWEKANTFL